MCGAYHLVSAPADMTIIIEFSGDYSDVPLSQNGRAYVASDTSMWTSDKSASNADHKARQLADTKPSIK